MSHKPQVAVVTGSRSEWGLLNPVVDKLDNPMLFCTGSHLIEQFGNTKKEIKKSYIEIQSMFDGDSPYDISCNIGSIIVAISARFTKRRPDIIILLGDRYETFACAVASYTMGIPIAHIHGGEYTLGSLDNAWRDCITRMSTLHFVAHSDYKERVSRIVNSVDNIIVVGALGCDGLERWHGKRDKIIMLFHPNDDVKSLNLHDLKLYLRKAYPAHVVLWIGSNADAGWSQYRGEIASLPRDTFIQYLKESLFIIGNSSCGIIEAPALGTPTINVGNRQEGRLMTQSIWNCSSEFGAIKACIDAMVVDNKYDFEYLPYKGENVSQKIVDGVYEYLS